MNNSNRIKILFFLIAPLLIGGLIFIFLKKNHAQNEAASRSEAPVSSRAGKVTPSIQSSNSLPSMHRKTNRGPTNSASSIYSDQSKSNTSRFVSLYQRAISGDPDAMHLAFQIQQDCKLWSALSPKSYPKEKWNSNMQASYETLNGKCQGISSEVGFSKLQKVSDEQPRDFFDQGIREDIRKAYADVGVDKAISISLERFENRPDPVTANVIATTLSEMDVTKYDSVYSFTGTNSLNTDYRRSIFETALNILACDYGVPCGPGSEVVLSMCLNSGACYPNYSLDQIYEQALLSGEDIQNLRSVLAALRKKTDEMSQP